MSWSSTETIGLTDYAPIPRSLLDSTLLLAGTLRLFALGLHASGRLRMAKQWIQ